MGLLLLLLSTRRVELEDRRDDDKWNLFICQKIISDVYVIFCFVYRMRLLRISFKAFSQILTPYKLAPTSSGFSNSMVSSRQFCCFICDWEHQMVPFFDVITSFVLNLREWTSDAFKFQIPLPNNAYPRNIPNKTYLPNWRNLDWSLQKSDDIQSSYQTEWPDLCMILRIVFDKGSSYLPRSLNISKIAAACHRISTSWFIQVWLP